MNDNRMDFEQFETIYNTAREMINSVQKLFKLSDTLDHIPGYLYVEVLRLHNTSVDFTEAYTKYLENKEEN